jgi:zinc-ribbon domain
MICRNCGTEIADKAIVCYRCGTGTADPVRKPAEVRARGVPVVPLILAILLALAALFLGYEYQVFGVDILIDFPAVHA